MERIDHVNVGKVCRGSLISDIDRVLERDGPDWECLELCITGLDAALVLVIKL